MELNDEMLCAYIDGELDERQRQQVEDGLAADAGARLRLARMREADAQLRAAFPLVTTADDDPLAELIAGHRATPVAAPAAPTATAASMPPQAIRTPTATRRNWRRRTPLLTALAAGIGAISVSVALLLSGGDRSGQADAVLSAALDQLPSGGERVEGGGYTRLVLSFKADDGRWCRVFEQKVADEQRDGLACHDSQGWQVVALETGAAGEPGMKPAGASASIDAMMDRLGKAPVAEPDTEQRLISQGWSESAR